MRRFYNFVQIDADNAELDIYGDIVNGDKWIYDAYGMECTDQVDFKKQMDALGSVKNIKVYINSNGGDPFAALTIYNLLKRHPANVTVQIDGLAASAATIPVCAGDRVLMPAGDMMLFHNIRVGLLGWYTGDELRDIAQSNDQVEKGIAEAYATKSTLPEKQLLKLLDGENWRTAKECRDLGFVDEILYEQKTAPVVNAGRYVVINSIAHDLGRYKANPFLPTDPPIPAEPNPEPALLLKQQARFYNLRKKINQ